MALFSFFITQLYILENWKLWLAIALPILSILWFSTASQPIQDGKTPPSLPEFLPGLSNAYRYIFHNMDFLNHVKKNFPNQAILRFNMGPKGFYLINEAKNANAVVRTSGHLSSDALIYMAMKQLDAVSAKDIKKYEEDTSSRYQVGGPGVSEKAQVWAPIHRLFTDHLASKTGVETLQGKFCEMFSETLHRQPKGEWKEVRLYQFLQAEMARCAIIAIAGTEILDLNPGFVEAMWRFDENVYPMALSVPRLFYGKPYKARDKFHDMGEKWLAIVSEKYDWSGPDVDWEPLFGTRYLRSHAKLLMDRDFDLRSKVGLLLGGVWASNANSIPMTGWLMIHLIQDKALFDAVREAVRSSVIIDPKTGKMNLDMTKLIDVPLLQSLYTETLRMHVSINITREVMQDMNLDGYTLKKGYLVQTPSHIAHFDESIWTDADHPTTEFWAERHIKYVDEVDDTGKVKSVPTFSTQGRSGGYFPYGGGSSMCPGRHFAKQEMITAMALLVINFDIELVEYVNNDGSTSMRAPKDNPWYCGTAAMPPDLDLKIRWKRL